MYSRDELTVSNKLFCKLFKEIVFARPGHEAIQKITFLLKVGSRYKTFLQYLFKKNGNNELLKAGPKGVLYYNEGNFINIFAFKKCCTRIGVL